MTMTMLICGVTWLFGLVGGLIVRSLTMRGDDGGADFAEGRATRLAVAGLAGGACGSILWSLLLIGPTTTLLIDSGEFAWLPYVTAYPFLAVLAGALLGLVVAIALRRPSRRFPLSLRSVGVVALGWAGYGLVLARVPAFSDFPATVVLAQRGVAALGSAALTIVVVDLLLHPPIARPRGWQILERLLLIVVGAQLLLLAQTTVWDEALARMLGLPLR